MGVLCVCVLGGGLYFRLITSVEIIKPSVCPVIACACEHGILSSCPYLFQYWCIVV